MGKLGDGNTFISEHWKLFMMSAASWFPHNVHQHGWWQHHNLCRVIRKPKYSSIPHQVVCCQGNNFCFWFVSSTSSTSHYRHITAIPPSTDKTSAVYAPQLHDFLFFGKLVKDLLLIKIENRLLLWGKA